MSEPHPSNPNAARIREINDSIRYAMWSVFSVTAPLGDNRDVMAKEVEDLFAELEADGVITDRPDLLREVLVQRGQWRPMAG